MIYESDDLIGLGDMRSFFKKLKKGGKKFRKWIKKRKGRGRKKAKRISAGIDEAGREIRATRDAVVGKRRRAARGGAVALPLEPQGGGVMEWVKANPMIAAGGALAAVLLLARKK